MPETNSQEQPLTKDIEHIKVTSVALVDDSTLIAIGSCLVEPVVGVGKIPETEKILICTPYFSVSCTMDNANHHVIFG